MAEVVVAVVEGEEELTEEMKPWEQHSSVISIPRYDYNAPSSLLRHSHSGFLITCPIKREKSATKEAISILIKYIENNGNECLEGSDTENVKRRKLCSGDGDYAVSINGDPSKDESPLPTEGGSSVKQTPNLGLVKVTKSGLVLFTFPKGNSLDPVRIVSHLNQSMESGALKRPLWCHRILPIQATCELKEKDVTAAVSKLVLKFVGDESNKLSTPLKFAVAYSRRGIEENEIKVVEDSCSDPNLLYALLDRNKCFSVVAAAVQQAVSDAVVDLKSPELCILIELLPISGMPNGTLLTAITVLPRDLVTTKPRLCVKALVTDTKATKK